MVTLFIPAPANAQTNVKVLEWYAVDKPGPTGNIVVNPSEVSRIAVGISNTIYAVDTPNNKVYRSLNGGTTWSEITQQVLNAGAVPPFVNIAVAPDRASIVMVVADGGKSVLLSVDGGDTWTNTNVPSLDVAGIQTTIQCIAISRGYFLPPGTSTLWDAAIGTAKWGDTFTSGQVFTLQIGGTASVWRNQYVTVTSSPSPLPPVPPPATNGEVSSIAFSENYNRGDNVVLVLVSIASDIGVPPNKTLLCMGRIDNPNAAGATAWNNAAGYPITVVESGDDANLNPSLGVISSMALPSNYNAGSRMLFASYNRRDINPSTAAEAKNDVYRITDGAVPPVKPLNAGMTSGNIFANISKIAFYGSIPTQSSASTINYNQYITSGCDTGTASGAKLLAGDYYAGDYTGPGHSYVSTWPFVQVRRCLNPFDTNPSWQKANLPPSGPGSAQVAWNGSGTIAYCGTSQVSDTPAASPYPPYPSPDESAFSQSFDNGDNWQQMSLIDTIIRICDVAPSPDSSTLFLATYSASFEWVWRSAGEPLGQYWGRVLGIISTNPLEPRIILRLSPNYLTDYTIFVVEQGGDKATYKVAISHDRGNSWITRRVPAPVVDFVAADSKTAYVALENGWIRKTSDEAQIWQAPTDTKLLDPNMMRLTKNGHLFVGTQHARVTYSTDGGKNFTEIPQAVTNVAFDGDVQIVEDSNYITDRIIYAATDVADKGIWRWTVGVSTQWELIDKPVIDLGNGERFCGLVMGDEGTLYGGRLEIANPPDAGGMNRSLNPAETYKYKVEWDIVNRTLPLPPEPPVQFDPNAIFDNTVPFFKISGNLAENHLWSVTTHIDDSIPYNGYAVLPSAGAAVRVIPDLLPVAILTVGTVPNLGSFDVRIEESDTGTGGWTPVPLGNFPHITPANDETTYLITYHGEKKYLRAVVTAFNLGAGPSIPLAVSIQHQSIYRFIDNICKSGPYIDNLAEIGCDPVTGRNQAVDLRWEQLSLTDTHEVHLDKSKSMDKPVFSSFIIPYDVTSPAMVYLAGGEGIGGGALRMDLNDVFNSAFSENVSSGLEPVPSLECGHNYYWRARARHAVTGEYIRSPWSDAGQFVIKSGFKVTTPYYGPQLLSPANACGCACDAPVSFSWSPFKETTGYWFELSKNADMSNPLVHTVINQSTAYQYTGQMQCNTDYYWRVMAQRPSTSEWSAVFTFKTQPRVQEKQTIVAPVAVKLYIWFMIGVGTLLIVCLLLLIVQRGRQEE